MNLPEMELQQEQRPECPGRTNVVVQTHTEAGTLGLGAILASWLSAGDVLLLHGDLGAGKTMLAKGIARGLQIDAPVTSPSFTLVNEYAISPDAQIRAVLHLDLYRLDSMDELETIGFSDFMDAPDAVTLVEWPERALGALPDRYLLIEIVPVGEGERQFTISGAPFDAVWSERLADLKRLIRRLDQNGETT